MEKMRGRYDDNIKMAALPTMPQYDFEPNDFWIKRESGFAYHDEL